MIEPIIILQTIDIIDIIIIQWNFNEQSFVPNDGIMEAKKICNYVCKNKAGNGAFRELVDLILLTQKVKHKVTE